MISTTLPFDYVLHIDRGDRTRSSRTRPHGSRVRRATPGA
jgi:hypothetical protein